MTAFDFLLRGRAVPVSTGSPALCGGPARPLACLLLVAAILALSPAKASSVDWDGAGEEDGKSWLQSVGSNLRIATDVSVRPSYSYTRDGDDDHYSAIGFFGIDLYKVFTSRRGDWGTLTVQPYVTKLNNRHRHPPLFESANGGRLIYRNVHFTYTGLTRGWMNFRVGHFELPFGIETVINTNGTLRDYNQAGQFGIKGDWGFGINGSLPAWGYELALTRGRGQALKGDGSPFFLVGRVATAPERYWSLGLSGLVGETVTEAGSTRRQRVGLDGRIYHRNWTLITDLAGGTDAETDVLYGLVEVDWNNPLETLLLFTQTSVNHRTAGQTDETTVKNALGLRFLLSSGATLSCQWSQGLSGNNNQRPGELTTQARIRF